MLAPFSIARGLIVDSGQELEVFDWNLSSLDTQFVIKLSLSCTLHSFNSLCKFSTALAWNTKWM